MRANYLSNQPTTPCLYVFAAHRYNYYDLNKGFFFWAAALVVGCTSHWIFFVSWLVAGAMAPQVYEQQR